MPTLLLKRCHSLTDVLQPAGGWSVEVRDGYPCAITGVQYCTDTHCGVAMVTDGSQVRDTWRCREVAFLADCR